MEQYSSFRCSSVGLSEFEFFTIPHSSLNLYSITNSSTVRDRNAYVYICTTYIYVPIVLYSIIYLFPSFFLGENQCVQFVKCSKKQNRTDSSAT